MRKSYLLSLFLAEPLVINEDPQGQTSEPIKDLRISAFYKWKEQKE